VKPLDAAYHVVHDYEPDGAASLAPRLGKSSTQLCHEVKPPPGNMAKLGLVDAVKISDLTATCASSTHSRKPWAIAR
jgi:hypothetical protein